MVLGAAAPAAWARYDQLVREGSGHPWRALMTTLLEGAGVPGVPPLVEWLWSEQPRANLWRKPIPAMVTLARELAGCGATVAVLSNSEGKLAELLAEIGIADPFTAIIDSGKVGIEKPDPRIFAHTLAALGVAAIDPALPPVHIGDLWVADVAAARAVGWRAIWFGRHARPVDDAGVACAHDAVECRAALSRFGMLG
jgi:putative hydrolase of the HAD superfamily